MIIKAINLIFSHKTYLGCLILSLIIALIITPLIARLAKKLGIIDLPGARKIHTKEVPRMGGIAIFIALWTPILLLYFWENRISQSFEERWWEIAIIALAGSAVMLSGLLDDMRGLNAWEKLLVQVPIAFLFSWYIARFDSISVPGFGEFSLGIWSVPVTMLWIVGITNAFNLIDGIDGLAAGVAFIVAITNGIISAIAGNQFMAVIMFSLSGACLGFLRYNFTPARIFLGDSGSLLLGMSLATVSVSAYSKSNIVASFFVAVIILGYPMADTLIAMIRRKFYGKPIFSADLGHIHHRLLAKGLDHPKAALIIYSFCMALSALALGLVLENSLMTFIAVLLLTIMVSLGVYFLGFFRMFRVRRVRETKSKYLIAYHLAELLLAKLALVDTLEQIYALLEQAGKEFGFQGIEVRLNPARAPAGQNLNYLWENSSVREIEPKSGQAPVQLKNFLIPGEFLEARFCYDSKGMEEELREEYLVQLERLVKNANQRIKEIYSQNNLIKTPSKQAKNSGAL